MKIFVYEAQGRYARGGAVVVHHTPDEANAMLFASFGGGGWIRAGDPLPFFACDLNAYWLKLVAEFELLGLFGEPRIVSNTADVC